jgi:hypothetical protein
MNVVVLIGAHIGILMNSKMLIYRPSVVPLGSAVSGSMDFMSNPA